MASEIVERVARALLAKVVANTSEEWQRYRQSDSWRLFEDDARIAIEAMREPTKALRDLYEREVEAADVYEAIEFNEFWPKLIDAALA